MIMSDSRRIHCTAAAGPRSGDSAAAGSLDLRAPLFRSTAPSLFPARPFPLCATFRFSPLCAAPLSALFPLLVHPSLPLPSVFFHRPPRSASLDARLQSRGRVIAVFLSVQYSLCTVCKRIAAFMSSLHFSAFLVSLQPSAFSLSLSLRPPAALNLSFFCFRSHNRTDSSLH